jgi:hypothetical protein
MAIASMKVSPRVVVLALAVFLMADPARADSDGYYCAGPGYLAYQFGLAAPPVGQHRLYVVRIGGDSGIAEPDVLELKQFQVHGMRCDARSIELLAFDAVHIVELDARRPARYVTKPDPRRAGTVPPEWVNQSQNLGGWSRPVGTLETERVLLERDARGSTYFLEMMPMRIERCTLDVRSRVVQVDASGREVNARLLSEVKAFRDCGN